MKKFIIIKQYENFLSKSGKGKTLVVDFENGETIFHYAPDNKVVQMSNDSFFGIGKMKVSKENLKRTLIENPKYFEGELTVICGVTEETFSKVLRNRESYFKKMSTSESFLMITEMDKNEVKDLINLMSLSSVTVVEA